MPQKINATQLAQMILVGAAVLSLIACGDPSLRHRQSSALGILENSQWRVVSYSNHHPCRDLGDFSPVNDGRVRFEVNDEGFKVFGSSDTDGHRYELTPRSRHLAQRSTSVLVEGCKISMNANWNFTELHPTRWQAQYRAEYTSQGDCQELPATCTVSYQLRGEIR